MCLARRADGWDRSSVHRTARRLALAASAVVLLGGCGGGGGVSVAQAPVATMGPSSGPEAGADEEPFRVLGGDVTVAPEITATPEARVYADEPQCPAPPPGVEPDEAGTPGLEAALEEVGGKYDRMERGATGPNYTGIVVCEPGNFFTVFRVPGSAVFDAWVRKVAARHEVTVHLRDTKYSLADLERARAEVNGRRAVLERAGARLMSTGPEYRHGAYLDVGVQAHVAKARKILADLGDRVRVFRDAGAEAADAGGVNDRPSVPGATPAAEVPVPADAPSPSPEPEKPALDVTKLLPPPA